MAKPGWNFLSPLFFLYMMMELMEGGGGRGGGGAALTEDIALIQSTEGRALQGVIDSALTCPCMGLPLTRNPCQYSILSSYNMLNFDEILIQVYCMCH